MTTRRVAGPVVAGIPLLTEVPAELTYRPLRAPAWAASGPLDDPLLLRYEVGALPGDVPRAATGADGEHYFLDPSGELSYVGHPGGAAARQWMRTVRAGHEYVVRFETLQDLNLWEWWWKRRLWMYALTHRRRGLALHATLFLLPDGRAVVCPGVSGAGKSTIARLLLAGAPTTGVQVLSDDRAGLVLGADGSVEAWSTPWYSNAAASTAGHGPLAAVILLTQGFGAVLSPLEPNEVGRALMRTMALPFWSEALMAEALGMLDAMIGATRWWDFRFAPFAVEVDSLVPQLLAALGDR